MLRVGVGLRLAPAKLNAIKNNVRGINLFAVLVGVTARLNPTFGKNFLAFLKKLCQELRRIAPRRARNKIGLAFLARLCVAVNGNRQAGEGLPADCRFYFRLFGNSAFQNYAIDKSFPLKVVYLP